MMMHDSLYRDSQTHLSVAAATAGAMDSGLADFYFSPPPGYRGGETVEAQVVAEAQRACSNSSSSTEDIPYIPPPFFCRGLGPFAYKVEAPAPPSFS